MKKIHIYFWLALLGHLLLFLSFAAILTYSSPDTGQNDPLPAYVYQEEKHNPIPPTVAETPTPQKELPVSPQGIEAPKPLQKAAQTRTEHLSIGKGDQNINLNLKSKNSVDQPLMNLLTKATAAHLTYPKIAIDFRLRGTSTVGFIMSSNGQISHLQLLQSSGNQVLDQEAIDAISATSPLQGASAYLTKDEPFAFSIIFN